MFALESVFDCVLVYLCTANKDIEFNRVLVRFFGDGTDAVIDRLREREVHQLFGFYPDLRRCSNIFLISN